jgi:indolepyruvate ferredoxin oxidoreductase, alpha subunit
MVAMKHVGLNVAHDPLMSATSMGVVGGMVLVNADDPGIWSSQNEQDNRFIAEQAYLPVLEPSSVQEAKDMTVDAFKLSEKFGQIFMLRSVTRISHARGDVKFGEINQSPLKGVFKKRESNIIVPAFARKNRIALLERFARIKTDVENWPWNSTKLVPEARLGIIACGISYSYTLEALRWLGLEDKVSVLKIGTPHPLPEKKVIEFIKSVSEILVVEELEPFVENHVKVLAQEAAIVNKIHGKDVLPIRNELSIRIVAEAISKINGINLPTDYAEFDRRETSALAILPARPPTLCAGCPHRASFHAINMAVRKVKKDLGERVLCGDIGCYSLGINPPLSSYDVDCCMGAGFGIASGVARGQNGPVVGHLGDSTFFHSGIPAMIDAVFNKTRVTMIVLDNSTTAMTGLQPHPGAPGAGDMGIKPEDVARACNVKFVEVVDPFDLKKTTDVIEAAIRFEGPSMIVSRSMCRILVQRERRRRGEKTVPYKITTESCTECKLCLNSLGCPAITLENNKVTIDASQCDGCGLCAQVCPSRSILQGG